MRGDDDDDDDGSTSSSHTHTHTLCVYIIIYMYEIVPLTCLLSGGAGCPSVGGRARACRTSEL